MMNEPRLIGTHYQIETQIGQGGMGTVYRGRDNRTGETVAIKMLNPDVSANADSIERFIRESEALRRLNHPHIVRIFDTVHENDRYYLVMEYLPGGTLADRLSEQERLSLGHALEIALDLADALTRAHRLKIVHRDIKPQNVLLAADGTPRLTDFGVAHLKGRDRLTQTGALVGTISYLSPETFRGAPGDEMSDLWAFGVTLYQMFTGVHPFEAETTAYTMSRIVNDMVEPPLLVVDHIPLSLSDLIEKMLQKDRDDRPHSIRVIGTELETILDGLEANDWSSASRSNPLIIDMPESRFQSTPNQPTNIKPREMTPVSPLTLPAKRSLPPLVIGLVGIVLLAVVLLGILFSTMQNSSSSGRVLPVGANDTMVLVVDFMPDNTAVRPVGGLIADDLREHLELQLPSSNLKVRYLPEVMETAERARAVADALDAPLVIWGTYNDSTITANLMLGDATAIDDLWEEPARLERPLNIQLRLTDPHRQSLALNVLAAGSQLNNATNRVYDMTENLVMIDTLLPQVDRPEVATMGLAALVFDVHTGFVSRPEEGIELISEMLETEGNLSLLYTYRSALNLRVGRYDAALRDAQTAARLAPRSVTPHYYIGMTRLVNDDMSGAIEEFGTIIELQPERWFPYYFRGTLHYLNGSFALAKTDAEQSIANGPTASYPYTLMAMLSLRNGHIDNFQSNGRVVLGQFSDPQTASRVLRIVLGDDGQGEVPLGPYFAAFSNLLIGQYESAFVEAERGITSAPAFSDFYLLKGFAACNLQDYPAAEAAYTAGAAIDPSYGLFFLLRAEVRARQNNFTGSLSDLQQAGQLLPETSGFSGVDQLNSFVETFSCEDFVLQEPATAEPAAS